MSRRAEPKPRGVAEVGWALVEDKASLIWEAPEPYRQKLPRASSAKSVQACPAAIDFDARQFVVPAPVDLHLGIGFDEQKRPVLTNLAGERSTIRSKHLNQMIAVVARNEWRHPDRPIIQVITPYLFLADEPVYLNQTPPFMDYARDPWPGVLICGRFPVHIWPRPMMWAFEWYDTSKPLIVRRGQPWFYVRFEPGAPDRALRLVEAELKDDVRRYIASVSGVTNYVNRTYSLFDTAKRRRPKQLLYRKA
ncbi:hypothetical protein [Marinivivus vitaminiproducens]|uniref:hypothetical protein n=1 Tax=Marinivivus vitaminiproducens TaxID=3035935 RepID=UPI0027A07A19|nr:hypothetical protein P4R82_11790 [Geminicoccaceae bacterium SCSIO 64248]